MTVKFEKSLKITVLVEGNPKRANAAKRFALYLRPSVKCVGDYVKAVKASKLPGGEAIAYRDLAWDSRATVGFIKLG